MSWSTFQSQSSKLQEKGTYAAGSYSLSLVSLTSSGTNSFTYNQSGLGTYTTYTTTSGGLVTTLLGGGSSTQTVTTTQGNVISAWGNGNYSANSQGNYQQGVLALTSFTLTGTSSGYYYMLSTGSVATASLGPSSYSQTDTFNENNTLAEMGTYTSAGGNGAGVWSFSSYTSTTNRTEAKTDIAAGNTDITNVSVVLTVNGAGHTGQQTETAAGTFSNNLRVYTFAPNPTSLVTSVTLTGPSIPKFQPDPVPQNWMVSPGNGTWTPLSQLSLLNAVQPGKLLGAGSGSVPLATVPLAAIPPRLQGVVSPLPAGGYASPLVGLVGGPTGVGYGSLNAGWFIVQGGLLSANANLQPWNWLHQLSPNLFKAVSQSYQDVQFRLLSGLGPYVVLAKTLFENTASEVNAQITSNYWAIAWTIVDVTVGILDGLTFGAASKMLNPILTAIGVGVDTTSNAYRIGTYIGKALLIIVSLFNPAGWPAPGRPGHSGHPARRVGVQWLPSVSGR